MLANSCFLCSIRSYIFLRNILVSISIRPFDLALSHDFTQKILSLYITVIPSQRYFVFAACRIEIYKYELDFNRDRNNGMNTNIDDIHKYLNKWQAILRLQDWDIKSQTVNRNWRKTGDIIWKDTNGSRQRT